MMELEMEMEFQCKDDDAWYEVSVEIKGSEVIVHYEGYGNEYNETMQMEEFVSSIEGSRFRLPCREVQDQHCDQVKEGMDICASLVTDEENLMYFDAVVKEVCKSKHCLIDDEEQCTCTFKVLWKAGPNANEIISVSCQNICLLATESIQSHPVIKDFVKLVHYNLVRNEQKLSLDLNAVSVNLETEQLHASATRAGNHSSISTDCYSQISYPHIGSLSSTTINLNTDGNISMRKVNQFVELDHSVGNAEILMPCNSGWLEEEDCDIVPNENTGYKVTNNDMAGKSACHTADTRNERSNRSEVHLLAACGGLERPSSSSDLDGVDTLSSSYLTTSCLNYNRSDNTREFLECSAYLQSDLENAKKTVLVVHENKQSVKQVLGKEVLAWKIPSKVFEISAGNKILEFQLKSNASDDINALRSSCFTTSDLKVNLRNDLSDSVKDSSDYLDQTEYKPDIVKSVNKHEQLNGKKKRSQEFLAEVMYISSDEDHDHDTSKKQCDHRSQGLSRQHGNHIQLHKDESMIEKIKDCTCNCACQKNVQGTNEDITIFRSKYKGQKTSPGSLKVYSQRSESHTRQTSLATCNQCKTYSDNSFTGHCKYCLKPSITRCFELHSCDVSAFSENESDFDGEETGHNRVSNCNHCRKPTKVTISSNTTNMRIQRGLDEATCGCIDTGCGHFNIDVRGEERQILYSEVLVLDNLEIDVSPFDVKKVISSMGCSVVHVYILPSLKFEQITKGFVWFKDHASLVKALGCLQDANYFIVSSNGRPWVVRHIGNGVYEDIFEGFEISPMENAESKQRTSSKISFVYRGTEDYEKAKRRKTIYLEFNEQLTLLHKRFGFEEKFLQSPEM